MAQVPLPAERIISQTVSGRPKSEVLHMLQQRHPGTAYHFIEDKMSTLEKVRLAENLDGIRPFSNWKCHMLQPPDTGYHVIEDKMSTLEKVLLLSTMQMKLRASLAVLTLNLQIRHVETVSFFHLPACLPFRSDQGTISWKEGTISAVPELEAWQLYLVKWGYNTPQFSLRAMVSNSFLLYICTRCARWWIWRRGSCTWRIGATTHRRSGSGLKQTHGLSCSASATTLPKRLAPHDAATSQPVAAVAQLLLCCAETAATHLLQRVFHDCGAPRIESGKVMQGLPPDVADRRILATCRTGFAGMMLQHLLWLHANWQLIKRLQHR